METSYGSLLILICLVLLFAGCSAPRITHPGFTANRYVSDYSIHVYNDSLRLHFTSPADIDYRTQTQEVEKRVAGEPWMEGLPVLIYGKTHTAPYYELLVFASEKPLEIPAQDYVLYDTLLDGHYFYFMGIPAESKDRLATENDTRRMIRTVEMGDDYNRTIISVNKVMDRHMNSHKYLEALRELESYPDQGNQYMSQKFQMTLTFSSFLGENETYHSLKKEYEERLPVRKDIKKMADESPYTNEKAVEKILAMTRGQELVMINENHFYPEHRILVQDLLPGLREQGFNYLALEALVIEEAPRLNYPDTVPLMRTGFYTHEQQFDHLIRTAKDLGFKLVAYESIGQGDREAGQAHKLYDATFAADPSAKVVVLAGLDHIFESSGENSNPRMAQLFKALYGIDPVTISQAQLGHYPLKNDIWYVFLDAADLPPVYRNVDYHVINKRKNTPGYDHVMTPFINEFGTEIQIAHFFGDEIPNINFLPDYVPYYTTVIPAGQETMVPLASGQTTIRVVYDQYGNQLRLGAIPPPDNP